MRLTIVTSFTLAVLAACSNAPGGSTPQEVFEMAKAASVKKDWKGLYFTLDPETCSGFIGNLLFVAGVITTSGKGREEREKKLKDIFERHGIREDAAEGALKDIHKPALFVDLMKFIESTDPTGIEWIVMNGKTLKDMKTDGDWATGTLMWSDGRDAGPPPGNIEFVKRDGRWYQSAKK